MRLLKTVSMLAVFVIAVTAAPAASHAQAAKTVTCKDNTSSKAGRGACSGHGGVAEASPAKAAPAQAAPAKAADAPAPEKKKTTASEMRTKTSPKTPPAPTKTAPTTPAAPTKTAAPPTTKVEGKATAKCKDGTMSYAKNHTGACSSHGGVAEWLDGTKKTP